MQPEKTKLCYHARSPLKCPCFCREDKPKCARQWHKPRTT